MLSMWSEAHVSHHVENKDDQVQLEWSSKKVINLINDLLFLISSVKYYT